MLVGLLRHGETEGGNRFRGNTDDPLTATGLAQMHTAIDDSGRWDRVISSPLSRCAAFAGDFARQHALPLTFDTRLKEMHFGIWEGRTAAELMAENPEPLIRFWNDPNTYAPPGGESLASFQARVLDAWNDIIADHHGPGMLVVTHGGVIRVLLCHVTGAPLARLHDFEVQHGQLHDVHIGSDGLARPACEKIARM